MKKIIHSLLLIIGASIISLNSFAEFSVKDLYQPTQPKKLYSEDEAYDAQYPFGIKYTFMPYRDPNFDEALGTNNPLLNTNFDSYNLIIIVNKVSRKDQWGRGQTMRVYQRNIESNAGLIYYWYVSTGLKGFETNSGYFIPKSFSSRHWSKLFDAPMRSSVFFLGGKALHASIDTDALKALGTVYSHGCVHIEDNRAEEIFHRIGHSGYGEVDVIDENTGKKKLIDALPVRSLAYKTLIIVH